MVVTMIAMGMMQVVVDEIINVIAVGYRLVSAIGAVDVSGIVTAAIMARRAALRVLRTDFKGMLLD